MMRMNTAFSSLLKIQAGKSKYYRNINQEVAVVPIKFVEGSLLMQRLWPGNAAL
jgi:hypothetical protein